ncbi:hypothetical protein PATSB16_13450 [Pandoraea thiooxydans]|nr:hypothetical protein PATSB16_13450 [Pandoraea thiooxydans]
MAACVQFIGATSVRAATCPANFSRYACMFERRQLALA